MMLVASPLGPPSTTTLTTFAAGVTGPVGVVPDKLPVPPPHEIALRQIKAPHPWRRPRAVIADPRWRHRSELRRASTHGLQMHARGRGPRRPGRFAQCA